MHAQCVDRNSLKKCEWLVLVWAEGHKLFFKEPEKYFQLCGPRSERQGMMQVLYKQ